MPFVFFVAIIVLQAFLVLVHLAAAAGIAAAFGTFGLSSAVFSALFVVLSFVPVSSLLIARRSTGRVVDWYYTAGSCWLGLVFFLLAGGVLFYFFAALFYAANYYVPPVAIGAVTFGAFILLYLYGMWQSARITVARIKIALPGLPEEWRGKQVAFVSDLHLGCIRKEAFAASVAANIRAFHPELLLIGGDLYDGPACDERGIIAPLRALVADVPRGVLFVKGNHEYFLAEPERAFAAIREAGIRILDNETADLGGLRIVGVDYKTTRRREDFKKAIAAIGGALSAPGKPAILLKHEPIDLDVARDAGIVAGLFGHTHRGQVWPLAYIARRAYRGFDYGLKMLDAFTAYTSSGVGTWGPPLRIGTRSEIVLITLTNSS